MYLVSGFYKIHAAGQGDSCVGGTLAHECATEAVNFYFYRLSSLYIEYAVLSVDESRGVVGAFFDDSATGIFLGCGGCRDVDGFAGGIVFNGAAGIVAANLRGRFYSSVNLAGDFLVSSCLSGDDYTATRLVSGVLDDIISPAHAGNG